MKKILLVLLLMPVFANAQIITTFAGGGTSGLGDGGPATTALVANPYCGAFDVYGNFYFGQSASSPRLRMVDVTGVIHTVAGTGSAGFSGDMGPATAAKLSSSFSFTVDASGDLFIADWHNNRIRKVDHSTGIINTIAGTGVATMTGDGSPATSATLIPGYICLDKWNNIYEIDSLGTKVRKIDTNGIITLVAGNGIEGYTGDGGHATAASIMGSALCVDSLGNIYLGCDSVIRKVSISTGIISRFAGIGSGSYSGDGLHADSAGFFVAYAMCFDSIGNLYIADQNNRIREINTSGIIHTIACDGVIGYSGDGGPATLAEMHFPQGVATDACGNVYFADDENNRIRKVTINPTCDIAALNIAATVAPTLIIYPNPTKDILNIDNLKTPFNYQLQNITGITLRQGTLKQGNNTISLPSLPPGLYLLELVDDEGNKTMKKIIKE